MNLTESRSDANRFGQNYAPRSVTLSNLKKAPQDYREYLVRIMSMQAYAERLGAIELGPWIAHAPTYRERKVIGRILSDEARHAYLLYRELDALGVCEEEAIAIAEGKTGVGANSASLAGPKEVANQENDWLDIVLNHMFLDRAGKFMVKNFSESSYAPWAEACRKILKDEYLHEGFGYSELRRYLREGYDRQALSSRATHWYALGLNFFGPPNVSERAKKLRDYGLKRKTNQELREVYQQEVKTLMSKVNAEDLLQLNKTEFPYA